MKILIACHAGDEIGLGHLSRCLVLARHLNCDSGTKVSILISGKKIKRHELDAINHYFVEKNVDIISEAEKNCNKNKTDLVIFDLNEQQLPNKEIQIKQLNTVRRSVTRMIAIDSFLENTDLFDLTVIPSIENLAKYKINKSANICSGWNYLLPNIDESLRQPWRHGNKLLILTGGSDSTGIGITLPQKLDKILNNKTEINWVRGPYAKNPLMPQNSKIKFFIHNAPNGLSKLMSTTNYALTIFGASFYELLYMGIPTVVFSPYGERDRKILEEINKKGIAIVACDEYEACGKIHDLMRNDELATELVENMKAIKNHTGVSNTCKQIRNLSYR